jgi:hypothetical protein
LDFRWGYWVDWALGSRGCLRFRAWYWARRHFERWTSSVATHVGVV